MELCVASFIVGMLLFVRYYRIPVAPLERLLAIGFCLYSCFFVISDSMYEHWRQPIGPVWGYLDILTFFASLLVWAAAVNRYSEIPKPAAQPEMSPESYRELSRELNSRWQVLYNRLDHLFRSGDSQQ
jgi:hypothetical protein